ncbi:MAG: ArgE/DapE family deacylase [Mesorhizobium sp.]|uniref:ArgE/DapE family deacylase n=1 Tax=Mesorhizobium sp. TaxID=1871066 RepID=UPI000FE767E5|nr:ArgE/DapE family deacylase [Mesorhizobium sp.]RWL89267.1 MAG: ArgE/DapE family deacylase [Mesorhizobium sp.]TIP39714.1 MAG: ArgE/DapE family deacylase [Mesorhizobium sp.]TJV68001.1 MAG: ArgE/DapE family deacylase [Mesorhizobium sp.]
MNERSSVPHPAGGIALDNSPLTPSDIDQIIKAVEGRFNEQVEFLAQLVRTPSLRGMEAGVQRIVSDALQKRGYDVQRFAIDSDRIGKDPAFSPTSFALKNSTVVVGLKRTPREGGRSLALNAHVDVVPIGTSGRWKYEPFSATRDGDWLYGRGAGDMKAGLTANLFALDALSAAGYKLKGPVQFQSVIEEETTGNGAAMVLAEGFHADAVLISEPTNEKLVSANTGVLKFAVTVRGVPAHPFEVAAGRSAIDIAIRTIERLRQLEQEWIAERPISQPDFAGVDNPIALTIGTISGGEWLASVPSECRFEGRIGFYPGEVAEARASRFERFLRQAFSSDPQLKGCPEPEIEWVGVKQGGYVLTPGGEAEALLARAHSLAESSQRELQRFVMPCYLDAAVFTLHGNMTSLVYGPVAEHIHAVDERVSLSSLLRVTKAIALFAASWCGIEVAAEQA